ncbi:MAG: FecR domain-containing protein [Bacteroidota bacterium]
MKDDDKYQDDPRLARWLEGSLSEEEQRQLATEVDLDALQQRLDALESLRPPALQTDAAWEQLRNRRQPPQPAAIRRRLFVGLSVAASICLLLSAWWLLGDTGPTQFETAMGQQMAVDLPAGSQVQLHPGSSMRYLSDRWDRERVVQMEGSAFFDVTKGQPFSVNTSQGIVFVTGTQFDVYTFAGQFEVKCYEGSVQVRLATKTWDLVAGQAIRLKGQQEAQRWEMASGTAPDWQQNMSLYQEARLDRVFADVARRFAVPIQLDKNIGQRLYTGGVPHSDLTKALEIVCKSMKLTFEIKSDKQVYIRAK